MTRNLDGNLERSVLRLVDPSADMKALATQAGQIAFSHDQRDLRRYGEHDRDAVTRAAREWSARACETLTPAALHAFVQAWCDAAEVENIDPIVWGYSWTREGWAR